MVAIAGKTKPVASRISRHKKKYWRKGTDIFDAVKPTSGKNQGSVETKADDDVFAIDRTPKEPKQYTKRQQAALDKITRNIGKEKPQPLPAPKFPVKKQPKLRRRIQQPEPVVPVQQKEAYDLWEKDFVPKVELEFKEAGEHLLRYTKKKLPNTPKTCRFKPSLLDPVALPDAGVSYNPKAEDYEKYIEKIVLDETKLMEEEERIQKASKPKFESVVTHAERELEQTEGLVIDPRYNADDNENEEVKEGEDVHMEDAGVKVSISELKRKTRQQRQKALKEKKLQREHKKRKEMEKRQHDVYKAKTINRRLERVEKETLEKAAKRKKEKFLKKMTTRQRLGGGEFKDCEDPFLLQEELVDSLRKLKPQGHVLNDRMASLQKRNMLPIGGERNKKKLKTKLKKKYVEKRSVAEVTKGSRVI